MKYDSILLPPVVDSKSATPVSPPAGSETEIKYLDFSFVSSVTVQNKPSLFAGKVHALLCREYIKGRDWYDFLWYTSQKIKINFKFLASALKQQGPWKGHDVGHQGWNPADRTNCRSFHKLCYHRGIFPSSIIESAFSSIST